MFIKLILKDCQEQKKDVDEEKKDYVKIVETDIKPILQRHLQQKVLSEGYDTMYENIIRNASYVRKIFGIGKNTFRIYAEGKKRSEILLILMIWSIWH